MTQMISGRRVHLDFLGCRLNQAEIDRIGRDFKARGDVLTDSPADADLVVINTCAVTNEATRKSRQLILQAGRANPDVEIVATGCYAELEPDKINTLPNVNTIISNLDKDHLVPLIHAEDSIPDFEQEPIQRDPLPPGTLGHTRAFVKVQDGCDNKCTFCITTVARGEGRSRPLNEIIDEIKRLVQIGYQEVVLTGVHLGSYGYDFEEDFGLFKLVKAILHRTDVPRIRLSSLEPWDLSPEFFSLWQDSRVCPHLHLPLQSGCDETLRRMARKTGQKSFSDLVKSAQTQIPDLCLTTDIIVGFPGETDQEFEQTLAFVQSIDFARMHIFPYSVRPGTGAERLPGHVSNDIKRARKRILMELSDQQWLAFQRSQLDKTYQVLWESARGATSDGFLWSGYTENYLRVSTISPETLVNQITPFTLLTLTPDGLQGEIPGAY